MIPQSFVRVTFRGITNQDEYGNVGISFDSPSGEPIRVCLDEGNTEKLIDFIQAMRSAYGQKISATG